MVKCRLLLPQLCGSYFFPAILILAYPIFILTKKVGGGRGKFSAPPPFHKLLSSNTFKSQMVNTKYALLISAFKVTIELQIL